MIPWIAFTLIGAFFTVAGAKLALGKNDNYAMAGLALLILGPGILFLGLMGLRALML